MRLWLLDKTNMKLLLALILVAIIGLAIGGITDMLFMMAVLLITYFLTTKRK